MRQHGDSGHRGVVGLDEDASQCRLQTEHVLVAARDAKPLHLARGTTVEHSVVESGPCGEHFESLRLLAPVFEVRPARGANRPRDGRAGHAHGHDLIGAGKRQRRDHRVVHDRPGCDRRGQRDSQRDDDRHGRPWLTTNEAHALRQIRGNTKRHPRARRARAQRDRRSALGERTNRRPCLPPVPAFRGGNAFAAGNPVELLPRVLQDERSIVAIGSQTEQEGRQARR